MKHNIPKNIENVQIKVLPGYNDEDYADSAEDTLLELFSNHDHNQQAAREKILNKDPSWPLLYHLSPQRASLLDWYVFKKNASVLEVGSGCGAITEALVEKDIELTSIELTKKRSLINAHRNRKAKNLDIVVGNIDSYKTKAAHDYVVCVGVLEYAGSFIRSDQPYFDFAKTLFKYLVSEGTLLLAIENRLGLKYWAGAKEDHTQSYFDGLNGYPGEKKVQTFGKKELEDLLLSAGFSSTKFYYPFPDYKLPSMVYSEDYHPGKGALFPIERLPTPTLDRGREYLFSEQAAMLQIEKNGLFPDLSNSFLVEATV